LCKLDFFFQKISDKYLGLLLDDLYTALKNKPGNNITQFCSNTLGIWKDSPIWDRLYQASYNYTELAAGYCNRQETSCKHLAEKME